jgi:fatty acyl-CoA reductase
MKRLDAFVHASTAYANCDRSHVTESVYPPPAPWRRLIEGIEWLNDDMFDKITPALIGARPNTYTFTKAVAESMIADHDEANKHLPIVIVRPSIVTAVWRDPLPGWIDNVNGATGLIALGAKGLLRSLCGDLYRTRADVVPVDVVANTLIVAAWHRASAKGSPMPVIHCTTGTLNPVYWGHVVDSTVDFFTNEMPLVDLYRIPGGGVTTSPIMHRLCLLFNHLLPAYALDLFCKITGRKAIMVRTYDKILKVLTTLEYFYTRTWDFDSSGIVSVNNRLSEVDRQIFYIDVKGIDWFSYFKQYHGGVRKYIFKELPSSVTTAKKVQFRRRLISNVVLISLIVILLLFIARYFFGII